MKKPAEMNSLVNVIKSLGSKGWDHEFRMTNEGFTCIDEQKTYDPEDLKIIKTYRFEGDSNPDDSSILYIIRTRDGNITGYCTDIYGAYSNSTELDEFLRKVEVVRNEETLLDAELHAHTEKEKK